MKRGGRPNVLNKAGKIVIRRLDTKKETSPQGNPHTVSKPSPERVMKSCLKCLKKLDTTLLSLPSNAQLVSNL